MILSLFSQEMPSYTPQSPVKKQHSTEERLGTLGLSSPLTPRMINLGLSEERKQLLSGDTRNLDIIS